MNAGDLVNADAYAAKAVELKSIEAHYVLGMVLFKKQKLSEAKAEFESLLRFKVNHVGALTNHWDWCLWNSTSRTKRLKISRKPSKLKRTTLWL